MGKIYKSAADLIGNTPLVEVGHIEEKFGLKARVLVKLDVYKRQMRDLLHLQQ